MVYSKAFVSSTHIKAFVSSTTKAFVSSTLKAFAFSDKRVRFQHKTLETNVLEIKTFVSSDKRIRVTCTSAFGGE